MLHLRQYIYILFLLGLVLGLQSCRDDDLYISDSNFPEGETSLLCDFSFSPFSAGNLTRASYEDNLKNGDPTAKAYKDLTDLVVLVYDQEGKLLEAPYGIQEIPFSESDLTNEERKDADASNGKSAETKTRHLKTNAVRVPFGRYYITAVANLGTDDGTVSTLDRLNTDYADDILTLDDLRRIRVIWDTENINNNREMLGYFDSPSASAPHKGSSFPLITVDKPNLSLRAWLRRCASKITVDFDASELRENIRIFIKDVRIYDIANSCTLGFGNPKSTEEDEADYNNRPASDDDLIKRTDYQELSSQAITFGEGSKYTGWPHVSKSTPYLMADGARREVHTEFSPALYFYENLQGDGKDRLPVPDLSNGGAVTDYNDKDQKRFGTYIEVTAHYISEVEGNSDEYNIKYRFMIGNNVTTNYDAERNHHYKLTLKCKGNANEYHWQIDYDQPDGFQVPNPWYVSYLYSHDAYLPFEFNLDPEWEVVDMKAEIVTNPWYPTNGEEDDEATLTDPSLPITPTVPHGDEISSYAYNEPLNQGNYNGFLSLRKPLETTVLTDKDAGHTWGKKENGGDIFYDETGITANQNYYEKNKIGERDLFLNAAPNLDWTDERERIYSKREGRKYEIKMPLFTREKVLIKETGYTGNNPFVGYQRVAKMKMTALCRKINDHKQTKTFEEYINVVQVRRVVNPKGVYRKSGNYEPFHVNLKFLSDESPTGSFRSVISRGPWMAEVLGDKNFITLDGKQQVGGETETQIDFTIRFNRVLSSSSGNKNAIVRIKYHNYTCTHLIFVRQGYDPQAICATGRDFNSPSEDGGSTPTLWNTFNMISRNKMAEDPRDEGSMFKFGTSGTAIDAINNAYKDKNGNEIYHDQVLNGFESQGPFVTLDGNGVASTKAWGDFKSSQEGFTSGEMRYAATLRDFEQLYLTKHVEFGYGVLYADGATETQSELSMVNGWHRADTSPDKDKKGMRGVFGYYWNVNDDNDKSNTKNVFFPIGRSGYGHRKEGFESSDNMGKGILRYSSNKYQPADSYDNPVYTYFKSVAPLFESIYRRPGAIYWARHTVAANNFLEWNGQPGSGTAYGLDFNYFTLDVNAITDGNVAKGEDACFVRTVSRSAGN